MDFIKLLEQVKQDIINDNRQAICGCIKSRAGEDVLDQLKPLFEPYRPVGIYGFWYSYDDPDAAKKRIHAIDNIIKDLTI